MKIPGTIQIARERGRLATKELIGRHIRCKFCESPDACVQAISGDLKVWCPQCLCESYFYNH